MLLYLAEHHENRIFSLKCRITFWLEFNQSLLDFCNVVELRLMFMLLYTP